MSRLVDKIALITGAASGIGLAAAMRFAEEGATVILTDRAEDHLKEALQVVSAKGGEHRAMPLDVTFESRWQSVVSEIAATYGRLDALVNNAGYGYFRPIAETTLEEWRTVMAVNLDSVFLGTKYALPLLARSGRGAIVNMSSIRGRVAGLNTASYSAAKAAVHLFTKSTALECAAAHNGVRANSVHPGQVVTPLTSRALADPAVRQATIDRIPLGRLGQPNEIAEAIVFLASDESSFMTGAEITLDGGFTAQ